MFRDTPVERLPPNYLVIGDPAERRHRLQFNAKVPGPT